MYLPPIHYGSFGNYRYNDCVYVAAANLVQSKYPTAKITTSEVIQAWRNGGMDYPYKGVAYLESAGFGSHTITGWNTVGKSKAALIRNTKQQAVIVNLSLGFGHEAIVTKANANGITIVLWGKITHKDWSWWKTYGINTYTVQWNIQSEDA